MILIVDDDETIRDMLASTMSDHNYETLTASSGEETLDVFSAYQSELQLVIMDIVMPGISGIDASDEMFLINADIPVILMSGHLFDLGKPFIQKPFRSSQILGMVRTFAR